MGAREYNYDDDQNRDYSDLSDQNQSALGRAQEKWGDAAVFDGQNSGSKYDANSLMNAENSAVSSSQKTSEDAILNGETSPQNRFNYTGGGGTHKSRNASAKGGKFGFFKNKKAALLGGGGLVAVSGGFMFFSFFGTMLAPIHIMEIITEKIGFSGTSTELRLDKFWTSKMNGAKCRTAFYCRFNKISDKQVKNLEKAGFKVEVEPSNISGKNKIKSLTHIESNTKIPNDTASIKKMMSDPKMKASWDKGYRGHFHTFLDKANKKFKGWFKARGAKANNKGKSVDEIQDDELARTNEGLDKTESGLSKDADPDGIKAEPDADPNFEPGKAEDEMLDLLKKSGDEVKGKTNAQKFEAFKGKADAFSNKISNAGNNIAKVCMIFTVTSLVVSGIKITKFTALIRFAFSFLSAASKIKANQSTTEEVEALGNPIMGIKTTSSEKLSSEEKQESGLKQMLKYFASVNTQPENHKSFTESQGWRAMAYGDSVGQLDDSAVNYTTGLTGPLGEILRVLTDNGLFRFGKRACKVVTTALAAVAIISGLSCLLTGGVTCITQAIAAAGIWGTAFGLANFAIGIFQGQIMDWARSQVGSILAGDFLNKVTLGQDYGNAVMSGAGATMSKNAMAGGASTLTKDQAMAMYFENEKLIAEKGAYERATRSPFDATSHHTFLGSIMANTLPYHRQMATIGGVLPAIGNIASRAFGSIMPTSHASSAAGFEANMNVCDDNSIKETGAATDIFCNVYAGVDTNVAKNMTTEEIVEKLIADDEIADGESEDIKTLVKSGSNFKKYLDSCYDRQVPIGVPVDDEGDDIGQNCNKQHFPNVDYYAVLMTDIRINEGMGEVATPTSAGGISEVDPELSALKGDFISPIKGWSKTELAFEGECGSSQDFGPRPCMLGQFEGSEFHNGLDLARPDGTPIYSVSDGTVKQAGPSTGCGNHFVIIQHNNGIESRYCHMSSHTVQSGMNVKKGQNIGAVGCEPGYPYCQGSHLHLEIHKDGKAIDPLQLIEGV